MADDVELNEGFKQDDRLTISSEEEQRQVRAPDMGCCQLHDTVVALQKHPSQVLYIHVSPPAHLCHDAAYVLLGYPQEDKADGAKLGERKTCEC